MRSTAPMRKSSENTPPKEHLGRVDRFCAGRSLDQWQRQLGLHVGRRNERVALRALTDRIKILWCERIANEIVHRQQNSALLGRPGQRLKQAHDGAANKIISPVALAQPLCAHGLCPFPRSLFDAPAGRRNCWTFPVPTPSGGSRRASACHPQGRSGAKHPAQPACRRRRVDRASTMIRWRKGGRSCSRPRKQLRQDRLGIAPGGAAL
jgi:hypothetical protein